jgi:hypothetical protein
VVLNIGQNTAPVGISVFSVDVVTMYCYQCIIKGIQRVPEMSSVTSKLLTSWTWFLKLHIWAIFISFLGCLIVFNALLGSVSEVDLLMSFILEQGAQSGLPSRAHRLSANSVSLIHTLAVG